MGRKEEKKDLGDEGIFGGLGDEKKF